MLRLPRLFVLLLLTGLLTACGGDDSPSGPESPDPPEGLVPDFLVPDVNATSARFGESVSPRDYLSSVSAYYFGHAT